MAPRLRWWSALAVPLVLAACDAEPSEERPAAESVEPSVSVPGGIRVTYTPQAMHDRYETVRTIRDALVAAELERAQTYARRLGPVDAELPEGEAREMRSWVPERAAELAEAEDLAGAARAFGATLRACGSCHAAASVEFTVADDDPPLGDGDAAHMRRHAWAMIRMWEGLVVANAGHFNQGATNLAEATLLGERATGDAATDEVARRLERRVHQLAGEESRRSSMDERAELFGELLATCASCHQQLGVHPHGISTED